MRKIILCIGLLLVLAIYGSSQEGGNWTNGTWQGKGREVQNGSTWSTFLRANYLW